MKHIRITCMAFCLLLASIVTAAAESSWRLWLDSSHIVDMAADGAGGAWCATQGGLVKWNPDGSCVKYTTLDGLPYNWTTAVAAGGGGAVWAGCMQGGVARLESGVWRTFPALPGTAAKCMAVDDTGNLWSASGYRVYTFDGTAWKSWHMNDVTGIAARDGKVWCGAGNGISCFDGASWKTFTTADGLADDKVTAVEAAPGGVVWAGSRRGVSRFDGVVWKTWQWSEYTNAAYRDSGISFNTVNDIAVDAAGSVWLATDRGLAKYDGISWETFVPGGDGLLYPALCGVASDGAGGVWIAYGYNAQSPRKISRFDGARWRHFAFDGPSSNEVAAVGVDRDGVKWFSAQGGGLSGFDGASWKAIIPEGADERWYFRDFAADASGARWFATQWGLWRYDNAGWNVFTTANSGIVSDDVYAVAIDGKGALWCGTKAGVCTFDGSVWHTYDDTGSPGGTRVLCIAEDHTGIRWFGTDSGLYSLSGAVWSSFAREPSVGTAGITAIAVDGRNMKWFATQAGLVRFDGERWERYTKDNSELPDDNVRTVAVDENRAVWLSTSLYTGVVRFDGVSWRKFDEPSGSGIRDIAVDAGNVKWFATYGGISSYYEGPIDITGVSDRPSVPAMIRLMGNDPNPFNASTTIRFSLGVSDRTELAVYDITGRKVRVLLSGIRAAGEHSAVWDARDANGRPVSSGAYLIRVTAGGGSETRKIMLLR